MTTPPDTTAMQQRSQEWFDARKGRLTASNFGAALGVSPWKSRQALFREMVFGVKDEPPKHIVEWGVEHEPEAILAYEMYSGMTVAKTGFHVHPDQDWLGASPDGLVGDNGLIEVKCPFSCSFPDEVPQNYLAQVHGQMSVLNRDWCCLWFWEPTGSAMSIIERDRELWEDKMLPRLQEFFSFVLEKNEPPRMRKGEKISIPAVKLHQTTGDMKF